MPEFRMPSLGADMEHGTIIKWLVQPGDAVRRGDIVVEVETKKADMEVEIFQDGVVGAILVPEGERVPVGEPLATIIAQAGVPSAGAPPSVAEPVAIPPAQEAEVAAEAPRKRVAKGARVTPTARSLADRLGLPLESVLGTGVGGTVTRADVERLARSRPEAKGRGSPRARRLAADAGLDWYALTGTGPGGAVTGEDVLRVLREEAPARPTAPVAVPAGPSPVGVSARQRVIGSLMERSKREIPHYYLSTTIDLSQVMSWLEVENAKRPVELRLVYTSVLLKAVASAVARVPEVNGHYQDGEFRPSADKHWRRHLAARRQPRRAFHPGRRRHSVDEIMASLRDLVNRARAGKFRASEMTNATITVTNLGDRGVEVVHGIIYPPQVALVGSGK
jgi:pyruvate dehydrogenase E2 component (dihydrolipoamide acetyltransferase)